MSRSQLKDDYRILSEVQAEAGAALFAKRNVVGLGLGSKIRGGIDLGEPCLTVFVERKLAPRELSEDDRIPPAFGRFRTDVVATGRFFSATIAASRLESAEPPDQPTYDYSLIQKVRPAPGGYSVGNIDLSANGKLLAGTIGAVVKDSAPDSKSSPKRYILSNNHVLARLNEAEKGSPILQPGPLDGGKDSKNTIARLTRFVELEFGGKPNLVDAAIAEGKPEDLDPGIYKIGYLKGTAEAEVGMEVRRVGRTSVLTTGKIISINCELGLIYLNGETAFFKDQILTTSVAELGDSGSLLCDMETNAVGLLTGNYGGGTIYNKIQNVERLLDVRLLTESEASIPAFCSRRSA